MIKGRWLIPLICALTLFVLYALALKMFEAIIGIVILIAGILLMTISSEKAVEHSVIFASTLGISPLIIGLTLVSIGTDLPETVNSIVSCALGHGNINLGDSIGSVLTQLTLMFGILPFFGSSFKVKRREILVTGTCVILALMLVTSIVEKGYISRINALFLVGSWPIYMLITKTMTRRRALKDAYPTEKTKRLYHVTIVILGLVGVTLGAYAVVQSVIMLSATFKIPEYLISFFLVAVGTSLPELAVNLTAVRKREYEIAIGDIIGSCIFDASFSIGIGPVLFPQAVSDQLASTITLYTIFVSAVAISILALREKVDKKAGIMLIALYSLSYIFLIHEAIS